MKKKLNWFICAEKNLIYKAAKQGLSLNNKTLYASRFPCLECAKAIVQSGIINIILIGAIITIIEQYKDNYNLVIKLLQETNTNLKIYDINKQNVELYENKRK